MFRTLFGRLSAALIALSLVLSLALALVLQSSHRSFHIETEQRLHQGLAAHLAARVESGDVDLDTTFEQIGELRLLNPALAAYALTADGVVVKASLPMVGLKRKRVAVAPVIEFIHGPAAWPLLGDDPSAERGKAVFSAARMARPAPAEFLYVVLGQVEADGSLFAPAERSYSLREALVLTLANVLAALIATLVLVGFITRPLRRLGNVMEDFDASKFSGPARYGVSRRSGAVRDEIDRLGEIFDSMADRIAQQIASLHRSDETRRDLYANVAHDLEAPLTAVHGYVETLVMKDEALSAEDRRHYLGIVRRQTEQLRELIGEIGDLGRLEMPGLALQKQEIWLGKLLAQIIEDLRPLLDEKQLEVRLRIDTPVPAITGDPGLLRRAFANVAVNAVQVAPPGSEIGIGVVDTPPEHVAILITDEGPGLSSEDIRRMFEPHYRGLPSVRSGSPGLGLGLAIARKVIELHGGTITASNVAGGGAQFCLTLKKNGRLAAPA